MIILSRLWRALVEGPEDVYLPKSWLNNVDQIRAYEDYTEQQKDPHGAIITGDTKEMAHRAFWKEHAEKQVAITTSANVIGFSRKRR